MLKMVDGTGIIGVDMVCPLGGTVSPPQPPNYDRVELEGAGMLVLPNSLDAPLERLELGGKTEQVQTSGKNLLDVDAIIDRKGINGSGEVISRTGSCVTDFIFLKPETYTFSLDNKSKDTQITIHLYNDDKSFNKYLLSNLNETSKIIVDKNMYMIVMFNKEKSIVLNKHVMLEIGSNKTPYEPYTGGKPSPSPEYPQEIKNVGKWNEEKQKYEVDVKITNAEQNWSKEQTLTLTSDRPLTKWDRLVEQGGEIGWLYESNRMVLYGSSMPWVKSIKPENIYFATTINNAFGGKGASFCKTYRNIQDSAYEIKYANERCIYSDHPTYTSGDKFFRAPNENVTTLEQWKELIGENPIEMLYHTKNSEFVPLPQSEQNAIRALKTYYPTTVITADGGELDPDIKVTYRKEI